MPTFTTNFNLAKPLVNSPVDEDLWGGELNDDMDIIDSIVYTAQRFVTRAVTTTDVSTTADNHKLLLCDATGGAFTVTLPAAASADDGFTLSIKKTDSTRNIVTVDGNASETIDGSSTYFISNANDCIVLVCDGANWKIISKSSEVVSTPVPSTSGTALDFTGIPSSVKEITLTLVNVTTTGTDPWLFQIGGGSYETTGYASASCLLQDVFPYVFNTRSTAGFVMNVINPGVSVSGVIRFILSNSATNTWVFESNISDSAMPSASNGVNYLGSGSKSLSGSLDRVRFTTTNGTDAFDGGSIGISYQ